MSAEKFPPPAPPPVEAFLELLIDQPLVAPETPGGLGPTLGEDTTPDYERDEDAKYIAPKKPSP
jgi:hypothetical protein